MSMPIDWSPFVEIVRQHQRFLLTTHVRPDGDGLGSQTALAEVLRRRGKEVRQVIASAWTPRYDFLDPGRRIERFTPPGDDWPDAIVVLDTGTWNQLGDFATYLKKSPAARVVIDHHLTQDDLGATRFVDATAEATARLVYDAIAALGEPLTEGAASALFVALAMDTGWFRHSNTSPATFALAGELTRAGARPPHLYDLLFEQNTLARLKLAGLVLDRLCVLADGQIAYCEIHRDDYARTGAVPADSEDLINYTRSVAGVEVGLMFMEQPRGGIKVSFRSRARLDVARIAERFGGGGHRLASGAIVEGSLEDVRGRVLDAVRAELLSAPAR
jgi:phosphoesterase RecJ-like protein